MPYRPPQRVVPAKVHTGSGWITGSFHLPKLDGFLDFLQRAGAYFNLTDVRLPGAAAPLPFFALRRSAVHLIEPTCPEWQVGLGPEPLGAHERLVSCLLDAGALAGRLVMPADQRVSDFVTRHDGFVVLRHAVLGPAHVPAPLLLVNTACLTGIADLGATRPGARPLASVRSAAPAADDEGVTVEIAAEGEG